MTQRFQEDGAAVPVTVVQAGPCTVTQVKTAAVDSYDAVQVGFGQKKHLPKPQQGHVKGLDTFGYFREFRLDQAADLDRGDVITANVFAPGDTVRIAGNSKGKGFQGVVRRHGFKGGKGSHGDKDQLRMPGSIGATDAARVFKGTRMGGQMGNATVTVKNLEIIEVDGEKNLLYIKGAVPGARNSLVRITAEGDMALNQPAKQESGGAGQAAENTSAPKSEQPEKSQKKEEQPGNAANNQKISSENSEASKKIDTKKPEANK